MKITEHKFESRVELIECLFPTVLEHLKEGLRKSDVASMLLSGGTTPGPLYNKLSNVDLEWEKVWFSPTDERWVEPDHIESNENLIRETLLINKAANANYVGLKSSPSDPFKGQLETEKKVLTLPRPFDVVLLGMGEDGHTASLFPGLESTQKALDMDREPLCAGIKRGGDDVERMTMTLRCLLDAKRVFLFFYGQKKIDVFNEARKAINDQYPVSYILNQNKIPVSLYWAP
ncbi:MAG: 6-phosphogluconolactonase [Emcibacteraceae bacterium]|nr:6-phosphogluconolactonase [Emcibacteraceae bacterium]